MSHNLSKLSPEAQADIELQKIASHQIYMLKKRMVGRAEIHRFMTEEISANEQDRFKYWLNHYMTLGK